MRSDLILIVLCALIYMLCGLIFSVAYIWNYRTEEGEARLGLMTFFWPAVLLFDLIMGIASQFGKATKRIAMKGMRG